MSNDLTTAAAAVKAYLDANPGATLAVSGYNDPTGNAALNAELSKQRAQGVKAALERIGIAPDRVALEKPAETTIANVDAAAARRVEVTVRN
ncbi:OmpA family protein [Sphingopyxis sp. PET50]|uniref:OmpA family protein n=1 Tax=Sphingopyxis sp. PET50 TaxID=2976533 RepID=UPI0021AF7E87|nr:OmpA family protein [Sphingopyxis sp. PET50]